MAKAQQEPDSLLTSAVVTANQIFDCCISAVPYTSVASEASFVQQNMHQDWQHELNLINTEMWCAVVRLSHVLEPGRTAV